MISKEDVKRVAHLARLGLQENELDKLKEDMLLILNYFEKLKKVDVSKVKTTSHSVDARNITREDKTEESSNINEKLLDLSSETKGGYLKVKSIL